MSYKQNIEGCFIKGSSVSVLEPYIQTNALQKFRKAFKAGNLAPLVWAKQKDDISTYKEALVQLAGFEDILILGTGGSSLGAKTLCSLKTSKKTRLHFMDNIDPHTFENLFRSIDLKKTGILAVSKSGSTVETLMQLLTCYQKMGEVASPQHFLIITEPKDSPLTRLAQAQGWRTLDHPTDVGGRFSCFSIVGILPALLGGMDVLAFRKGAQDVLDHHLSDSFPPAFEGAAINAYLQQHAGKTNSVMMPYADQLDTFSYWYRQLWAESLGKKGEGTTPISSLGTVDQHSHLQLYLDGPKDKFFTMLACSWKGKGDIIEGSEVSEFKGKTMGDLFEAEQQATYQTLIRNECPTRLITLNEIDEYHLGALMMHFMIETILTSYILGVDAFNQPAVEEGKRLAREYLAA